ncbi:unnamed protein product, partial [Ectocarpus fasciculatus]
PACKQDDRRTSRSDHINLHPIANGSLSCKTHGVPANGCAAVGEKVNPTHPGLRCACPHLGAYPHDERGKRHLPSHTTAPSLATLSRKESPQNLGIAFTNCLPPANAGVRDEYDKYQMPTPICQSGIR